MENLKSVRHAKQDLFSSIIKFEKILYEDSMEMSELIFQIKDMDNSNDIPIQTYLNNF